jgi:hypothetical protein
MTKPHRLTPEQWESIEQYAEDNDHDACLLDLRDRIEALEAAQQPRAFTGQVVAPITNQTGPGVGVALAQPEPVAPPMPMPGDAEGLAEVFWGRYDQPEPVAPTLKEVSDWILLEKKKGARWATATDHHEALPIACAAMHHALARYGTPANQPVPVSERLPGPEDCDGEGRCWWFSPPACGPHTIRPCWTFDSKTLEGDTHWLPHWALPVPGVEGADE